jgi:hypothetical protein
VRRYHLTKSVDQLLPEGERAIHVAYLWRRHHWMPVYALASFVGLVAVASAVGVEGWSARLVLGVGGAAVATSATTHYWVLASTTSGLVLFRGSRIRQQAAELVERLPPSTRIDRIGGSMVSPEWAIGDQTFATSRSHDQELHRLAAGASGQT